MAASGQCVNPTLGNTKPRHPGGAGEGCQQLAVESAFQGPQRQHSALVIGGKRIEPGRHVVEMSGFLGQQPLQRDPAADPLQHALIEPIGPDRPELDDHRHGKIGGAAVDAGGQRPDDPGFHPAEIEERRRLGQEIGRHVGQGAAGQMVGMALKEEGVARLVGQMFQRRLFDRAPMLGRHDLVAAQMLQEGERVHETRMQRRIAGQPLQQRLGGEDQPGILAREARDQRARVDGWPCVRRRGGVSPVFQIERLDIEDPPSKPSH